MAEAPVEDEVRVSTLELFFDLVFVFVVTQLSSVLERHTPWAPAHAALTLLAVYWMYGGFSWLTNALGDSVWRQRLALLTGMVAFLVVALAVPRAFGTDAVAFGAAYLALTLVHTITFLGLVGGTTFQAMLRIGSTNLVAAGLILGAAFLDDPARWILWCVAVLLQWGPPLLGSADLVPVAVAHFAERHGLMIIIVLGESVLSFAAVSAAESLSVRVAVGSVAGLLAVIALWWCYFDGEDESAAEALGARPPLSRGRVALVGYDLSHVLMLAGVVTIAGGTRLGLPDLTRPGGAEAAWLIALGAALYLAGLGLFRGVLGHAPWWTRAIGAACVLAVVPAGRLLGTAEELAAVAVVIAALLVGERRLSGP